MLEGISFLAIVRFGALLADHTLKRSDLPRLIHATQQDVERPVLDHHHNDVIQAFTWQAGSPAVSVLARRAPSVSAS